MGRVGAWWPRCFQRGPPFVVYCNILVFWISLFHCYVWHIMCLYIKVHLFSFALFLFWLSPQESLQEIHMITKLVQLNWLMELTKRVYLYHNVVGAYQRAYRSRYLAASTTKILRCPSTSFFLNSPWASPQAADQSPGLKTLSSEIFTFLPVPKQLSGGLVIVIQTTF